MTHWRLSSGCRRASLSVCVRAVRMGVNKVLRSVRVSACRAQNNETAAMWKCSLGNN